MAGSIVNRIKEAVINGDEENVKKLAEEALMSKFDPVQVIEQGLTAGMREVGDRFGRGEIFLSHMMMSADAMKVGVSILTQAFSAKDRDKMQTKTAKVVIGTVEGDIHDIGKNLVSTMLAVNGFQVYDLGKDVKAMTFVDKAEEYDARIIAASSLMIVSRPFMNDIISILKEKGVRDKYKVLVGGGAVTKEYADKIGADAYGAEAAEAASIVRGLLQG